MAFLITLEIDFTAEHPFPDIGIVDFFCSAAQLVIECDGNYWHSLPEVIIRDARKDRLLAAQGIFMLRLSETDINHQFEQVCQRIKDALVR